MFGIGNKKKREGKSASVDANKIGLQNKEGNDQEATYSPNFMLHPNFSVSKEEEYILRFFHSELEPLKQNQINLTGISLLKQEDGSLKVITFLRNSLPKNFTLDKTKLVVMDKDQQVIARHTANLQTLGTITSMTTMPIEIIFPSDKIKATEFETSDFSIQFDLSLPHHLDWDPAVKEQLSEETVEKITKIVEDLPEQKEDTVNFTGLKIQPLENGLTQVSLFIRNFYGKNIKIEQLPIKIFDANRVLFAEAQVKLENYEVKANTTKLLIVNLPKETIKNPDVDLSRWILTT